VENKGNEYIVADPSRMISMLIELNQAYKEMLKKELTEILMVELQEKLKENIQNQLKEYQENTNKKFEKTQKQLNELRKLQ
jgi:predicted alpha/beta-fold hydrolase